MSEDGNAALGAVILIVYLIFLFGAGLFRD
jgi:hypothetical protein